MIPAMKTSANAVLATPATQERAGVCVGHHGREMVVENAPSDHRGGSSGDWPLDPDMTDVLTYKLGGA